MIGDGTAQGFARSVFGDAVQRLVADAKEKHVLTIVRLAGEETAAQVDAELTKKLPLVGLGDVGTVARSTHRSELTHRLGEQHSRALT